MSVNRKTNLLVKDEADQTMFESRATGMANTSSPRHRRAGNGHYVRPERLDRF
jgi:hypothetical protein